MPLNTILGIVLLVTSMGYSSVTALGAMLLATITFGCVSGSFVKYNKLRNEIKDRATKIINECFKNIRFVKMNAAENYFLSR